MTFKEKCEFEALEQEIENLEKERKEIETALSGGVFPYEEIIRKSMHIVEITGLLDEKAMRWLELSEKT